MSKFIKIDPSDEYPDHPVLYNIEEDLDIWDNLLEYYAEYLFLIDPVNAMLKNINAINVNGTKNYIRFKSEKDIFLYKLKFSSKVN